MRPVADDLPLAWQALRANPRAFDALSDAETLALAYAHDLWLRPTQLIPAGAWRYYGFIAGRGFGKSTPIACEINRRVECGETTKIALMGPTETRVDEVQVEMLVETSPPWFRAEKYLGGVLWPNGVRAFPYTAEEPEGPRGPSFDLAWLTEIVAWDRSGAVTAFNNITTATRRGRRPQVLWDTTSKGYHEVIEHLLERNAENPARFPIVRGTMFDNHCLPPEYVKDELAKYVVGSRAYREEVLGEVLGEAAGALWQRAWLDAHRVADARPEHSVVAWDPALSTAPEADESGIVVVGRAGRHAYVTEDLSGRYPPEDSGDLVVSRCIDHGCAGVVVARNHAGDNPASWIRSRATNRGWSVVVIPTRDKRPIPPRQHGTIWVKELHESTSKGTRATPVATETEAGRVHLVGTFPELEQELTTWRPGRKSPNRLDAMVQGVTEVLELWRDVGASARACAALPGFRVPRVLGRY